LAITAAERANGLQKYHFSNLQNFFIGTRKISFVVEPTTLAPKLDKQNKNTSRRKVHQ